jgi:hypothetical protein
VVLRRQVVPTQIDGHLRHATSFGLVDQGYFRKSKTGRARHENVGLVASEDVRVAPTRFDLLHHRKPCSARHRQARHGCLRQQNSADRRALSKEASTIALESDRGQSARPKELLRDDRVNRASDTPRPIGVQLFNL